ncbi:hypothetical protein CALCODRAFT_48967 [Calocera cornea HHB12733]|uniref:Uncharacterized protein n=1 Tax=Calocera cornea HHB12733 TaxID=1353952 RepID=A0A165DUG8_9BASI|nr:hypothetical protein CALCODRAFT_48967 [Calocera cornea HHB12733]
MTTQPLRHNAALVHPHLATSAHISTVQHYVESQRQFAHIYAAEGAEEFATWATSTSSSRISAVLAMSPIPILETLSDNRINDHGKEEAKPAGEGGHESEGSCYPPTPPATTRKEDKFRRHYAADDEHERRLTERRERRRAKAAIMQPAALAKVQKPPKPSGKRKPETPSLSDECSDGSSSAPESKVRGKKGKKKKQKVVPVAMSMLNNLAPSNIGKDRLTLKPAPTIGVFNKGKASSKVTVKASNAHKTRKAACTYRSA